MNNKETLILFLNNVFDEAVLTGSSKAFLTASVLRSLRVSFGAKCFDLVVKELEQKNKLQWLEDIEAAGPNSSIVELRDYAS
jgi:hypothetical protein